MKLESGSDEKKGPNAMSNVNFIMQNIRSHRRILSSWSVWSDEWFNSSMDLPDPGIKLRSPALQADSLPTELRGKPY